MDPTLYSVPVIQQDLRQEETILQIADALECLARVIKDVFARVESKILENSKKLEEIHSRAAIATIKVNKLTGSNKATNVFSSAKYPAADMYKDYDSMFSYDTRLYFENIPITVKSRHTPLEGKVLQEKLQFYHVKENKHPHKNVEIAPDEGLGSLPKDLEYVNSLLLFNTSENPYRQYVMLDPLGAIMKTRSTVVDEEEQRMEDAPISISQREMLEHPAGENYFYSPGLGEVPQIDVPLDLPDLPGVADDLRYSMESEPMIAPSVSTTPAIPELPSLVPESPSSPHTVANLPPPPAPAPAPPIFLPPPPPPPPTTVPPPPPPPPPPPSPPSIPVTTESQKKALPFHEKQQDNSALKSTTDKPHGFPMGGSGDARADLMEAIRKAGGTGKANLRSAKEKKIEAKKKKQEQKAMGGGGDLMADLHVKLSMRRRGISGLNKPSGNESSVNGAMERVSAMIPPPSLTDHTSSNTDDEDWE